MTKLTTVILLSLATFFAISCNPDSEESGPDANTFSVNIRNQEPYALSVNTVSVGTYVSRLEEPMLIEPSKSAKVDVAVDGAVIASLNSCEVKVNSFSRSFKSADISESKKGVKSLDFPYDNKDKSIKEVTVWESDKYSAFADIVFFGEKYYVAFREAGGHVSNTYEERGAVIIRSSTDCKSWSDELTISNDLDLRDPHFCISADKKSLYVYYGTFEPRGVAGYFPEHSSGVSVLELDNSGRLALQEMKAVEMNSYSDYWLWSVTMHKGVIYGLAYGNLEDGRSYPVLVKSEDGVKFSKVCDMRYAINECHLCFVGDQAYLFARSCDSDGGYIFKSKNNAYTQWDVMPYPDVQMHCPVTLQIWDKVFVCVRGKNRGVPIYVFDPKDNSLKFVHDVFPNTSTDRAYAGMILHDDILHVAYYAYKTKMQNIYYQGIPALKLWELTNAASGL